MQSGNAAEMLQPWTTDKAAVLRTLKNKLISTKRSRISEAIANASVQLKDRPEGSRHVVMITDGVDSPGSKVDRAEAMQQTDRRTRHRTHHQLHGVCATEDREQIFVGIDRPASAQFRSDHRDRSDTASGHDSFAVVTASAFASIRRCAGMRKAYEAEVKKSQQALKNVAEETGGRMMLPLNSQEMLAQANEVARAIGAEYVVTYRPKRPLAEAKPGEYRRIEVASRRVGLSLQSRRGYVVPQIRISHKKAQKAQND